MSKTVDGKYDNTRFFPHHYYCTVLTNSSWVLKLLSTHLKEIDNCLVPDLSTVSFAITEFYRLVSAILSHRRLWDIT